MVAGTASRLGLAVVLALLANACQLQATIPPVKPGATKAPEPPRKASPGPATAPTSASPAASAAPLAASPSPAGLARLRVPAGAVERLAGQVRLDAGYMVAAGAGNVISHNGGLIVAAGGLNLIGADGGSLIGADGGSIVAAGAGNMVAAGAGNVISPNGGTILSHNGGQVLSPNGAQVLSHNGGQIISQNGGQAVAPTTWRLLQAAAPPPGALTPAAGIEIRVYELVTGRPVALGVDAQGASVWAVLTDAEGRYDLHLPPALAGNVLVTARVIGEDDPRLAYDLVSDPGASAAFATAVDEDTAVAARYLRRAFARKLRAVLDHEGADDAALVALLVAGTEASPELAGLARQVLGDFRARVAAAGVPKARHAALAERATDVLVGRLALEEVAVDVANTAWKGDAAEPSLAAMRAVLAKMREAAAAKLAADPAFFDTRSYMVVANEGRPASERLRVLKAADLGDVLVDTFFAGTDALRMNFVTDAFLDLGLPMSEVDHLFAAASGIGLRLGTSFLADEEARQAVFAAIDEAAKAP